MSKMKAIQGVINGQQFELYFKSEADKVISLLKDKANYNEEGYKIKKQELSDTCRFFEEELRLQKYKRCLAMAERCFESREYWRYRYVDWNDKGYDRTYKWRKVEFWGSWGRRWLELAKKFKETK